MTLALPIRFGTRAILYLTNTAADQGAFSCVADCHRWLGQWLKQIPAGEDPREVARKQFAGDTDCWRRRGSRDLASGAASCGDTELRVVPRVVQYLNMFLTDFEMNATWI